LIDRVLGYFPSVGYTVAAIVIAGVAVALSYRRGGRAHAPIMVAAAGVALVLVTDGQVPAVAWLGTGLLLVAAVLPAPLAMASAGIAGLTVLPWTSGAPWWLWLFVPLLVAWWTGLAWLFHRPSQGSSTERVALGVCAGGVFAAVPDTEAIFLVGVVLTALCVVPQWSRLSHAMAAAMIALAGIDGVVQRPATILALFAVTGLAPLAPRIDHRDRVMVPLALVAHVVAVLFAARYAGLSSSLPSTAGRTVVAVGVTGLAGAVVLIGRSLRQRS
jgi:hypothetical protein